MGELPVVDFFIRLLLQEHHLNRVTLVAHVADLCSQFHAIPQMNSQLTDKPESLLICY